jgi:hypothetical protein
MVRRPPDAEASMSDQRRHHSGTSRALPIPATLVHAASALDLAGRELREGDLVTVDGSDGHVQE